MGKGERIKQKKKELNERKAKGKVIAKLEVTVFEDESLNVEGPINDPLLVMQILAGAMNTIVKHNLLPQKQVADIEVERKEKEAARILNIVPDNDDKKIITI